MTEITDDQILQALRDKAKMYAKMAADFEKSLGRSQSKPPSTFTVGDLRSYLSQKGGRPGDLAKHFGVTEELIKRIIAEPDSGIEVAGRGWLKLKETLPG